MATSRPRSITEAVRRRRAALQPVVRGREYAEDLDGRDLPRVWLANRPVIAVTSVTVDGTALDNTAGDG